MAVRLDDDDDDEPVWELGLVPEVTCGALGLSSALVDPACVVGAAWTAAVADRVGCTEQYTLPCCPSIRV